MSLKGEIRRWSAIRKKELIASYNRKGFRASGQWERDLESKETVTPNRINVKLLGSDYTRYMINGRGPTQNSGTAQPSLQQIIRQWIDDKGIKPRGDMTKTQLSWAIATKIHKKGTRKPTPARRRLLSDVFTDKATDDLFEIIRNFTIQEIRTNFVKTFEK